MRRLIAMAVLLMTLAPAAHADPTYPPRVLPDSIGIGAQFLNPWFPITPAQEEDGVDSIQSSGLHLARVVVHWRLVEANPPHAVTGVHTYNWAAIDNDMTQLASRGIRAAPLFAGTPAWDALPLTGGVYPQSEKFAPIHPEYYAAFVAAYVQRYGPGGSFWAAHPTLTPFPPWSYEVWNEPNTGHFYNPYGGTCPAHTIGTDQGPKRYADLYAAAYTAIKAVYPAAVVMVGGLSGWTVVNDDRCTPYEFLAGMKVHRPSLVVDAIGMHIYRQTAALELAALADIRASIDVLGWPASLPLYLNEFGWITSPPTHAWATTDALRGDYLAEVTDKAVRSNCGVRQVIPHTWLTAETDVNNHEHWYGIANLDGTTKPSADEFAAMAATLEGYGSAPPNYGVEMLCPGRPVPDIDGDGYLDNADAYPADATRH